MAPAPQTLNHPTFGPCKFVPSIVAIKWTAPRDRRAIASTLSHYTLTLADETPKIADGPKKGRGASAAGRDPRAVNVNQSETLTWASGASGRKPSDSALKGIADDPNVEWVGPVYRANGAEP